MSKPHEHELTIRVRYAETDRMGLLHHANYFVYFEMGRTELLRQRGLTYREIEDSGPSPGHRRGRLQVQAPGVLRRPADAQDCGGEGDARQDRPPLPALPGRRPARRGPHDPGLRGPRRQAAATSRDPPLSGPVQIPTDRRGSGFILHGRAEEASASAMIAWRICSASASGMPISLRARSSLRCSSSETTRSATARRTRNSNSSR